MRKRTLTDVAEDVPAEATARLRRRLQESEARQLRSTERALAARELQLSAREQRVADVERALAAREQRVADAERALAAKERIANAQAALERVRLWLPALPKSDAGAPGGANDTQRPAAETLAKFDTAAPGGGTAACNDGNVAAGANDTQRPAADAGARGSEPGQQKTKREITVNIKKPGTETMCFITSTHRTLKKLMCRYCEIQALDVSDTKFFLELDSTDTGDGPRLVNGTVLHVLPRETMAATAASAGALE